MRNRRLDGYGVIVLVFRFLSGFRFLSWFRFGALEVALPTAPLLEHLGTTSRHVNDLYEMANFFAT